jgi:hypothetical protein
MRVCALFPSHPCECQRQTPIRDVRDNRRVRGRSEDSPVSSARQAPHWCRRQSTTTLYSAQLVRAARQLSSRSSSLELALPLFSHTHTHTGSHRAPMSPAHRRPDALRHGIVSGGDHRRDASHAALLVAVAVVSDLGDVSPPTPTCPKRRPCVIDLSSLHGAGSVAHGVDTLHSRLEHRA